MIYILEYYEPGKRAGKSRKARRKVKSVPEAVEWMNQNKAVAFLPATVVTNSWKKDVVAILGDNQP